MISFLNKHFGISAIGVSLLIAALMVGAKYAFNIDFKKEVDIAFFTGLPLFVLGLLQLYRTQRTQQATNIKDFLSEFRKDQALYSSYFDLVYSFDNNLFAKVKEKGEEKVSELRATHPNTKWKEIVVRLRPDCSCLETFQGNRGAGSRLFWPWLFVFSEEERRLDALLDYFNAVGFYEQEGLIDMRDIARILGDYLAVLDSRLIVKEYFKYCEESDYDETIGAPDPYPHLIILLDDFKKFNKQDGVKREVNKLKEKIRKVKSRTEQI
jgi:hypothetical protein